MSPSRNLLSALAAMLLVAPTLHAVDVTTVGDTKLRVYGFVHLYGNYFIDQDQNSASVFGSNFSKLGANSFFYTNVTDQSKFPTGTFRMNYAPTRLGFAMTTPSGDLGDVSTKIEMDFNGTNYPHIRLAQASFGDWTFGQTWSLWVDLDAGADTVDWAGPIGGPGYDNNRMMAINYSHKLDKNNALAFALEQAKGLGDGEVSTSGVTPAAKLPTLVGAYTHSGDWGHIRLAALAISYNGDVPATATQGSSKFSKTASAGQLSGAFNIAKDALVASVYTGSGLSDYGTGNQDYSINVATKEITLIKSTGWMVGYTHNWTDAVRSNIVLSGVSFSSDSDITGTDSTNGALAKSYFYGTVNTFVKVAKNVEVGMEFINESAKAFGSNNPWINKDAKGATKNSSNKIEVSLHVGF